MIATTIKPKPSPLIDYVCPVCAQRNLRRVLVRAQSGSVVEAFCRECRYRKVVRI